MRDHRLDIVRGVAIVIITLNHITGLFTLLADLDVVLPSLTDVGYTSAAEIFVALSGYMVGLAYIGRPDMVRKVLSRAGKLYIVNLLLFAASAAIVYSSTRELQEVTRFLYVFETEAWKAAVRAVVMFAPPAFLDVLPLYTLLLLAVPLMALLLARSTRLFAAVSVTVYAITQVILHLDGAVFPFHRFDWYFNIFAWQFLFFGFMALGHRRLHTAALDWFAQDRWRSLGALAVFALMGVLYRLNAGGDVEVMPMTDKTDLEPLRLLHNALTITAILALVALIPRQAENAALRALVMVGRQSLNAYAASVVLTYAAAVVWLAAAPHTVGYTVGYLMASATVLALVIAVAMQRSGTSLAVLWDGPPTPDLVHRPAEARPLRRHLGAPLPVHAAKRRDRDETSRHLGPGRGA
ncbi:OpgC domain-containing protein [Mongoliimonas terrestris]|uniref:OpgC domain-containing protein n=1 Tax=Mongoliimonas terrestris TaxID=1709001 RepID=UPI000949AB83|nr:OpgC domain-containing protein [Mongoliimonas terrestris]